VQGPIVTRSREHGITFWSEGVKQLSVPLRKTIRSPSRCKQTTVQF
jgi:hypothetical protein